MEIPVVNRDSWFTECFDTADLTKARAVLDELSINGEGR
jgi:hypothetical protein